MPDQRPYVVVLAGGEGTRLGRLTRALYGSELPKQFAVLAGQRSLLQQTIDRALLLTTDDRISVVVSAHHEARARTQLAAHPAIDLIVQPRNLDTGPGMLLPLVRILERDLLARVIFLPSDHYVPNAAPLVAALQGNTLQQIALVGVAPTGPEVEYGWIVRGQRLGRTDAFEVRRFEEKPVQAVADKLWRQGGLWNTFITTAPVAEYWSLARRYLPAHASAFEHYASAIGHCEERSQLAAAYEHMTAANFSHDILAHATQLAVIPVADTGWCDWGSPERVIASLAGTPDHDTLLARMTCEPPFAMAV
jgi:mannose-1-phosphate guanylyltransferase